MSSTDAHPPPEDNGYKSFNAVRYLYECGAAFTDCQGDVILAYIRHGDRSGRAWPSVASIAKASGRNQRSIKRAICQLEEMGIIITEGVREIPTIQQDGKAALVKRHPGGRHPSGHGFSARRRLDVGALMEIGRARMLKKLSPQQQSVDPTLGTTLKGLSYSDRTVTLNSDNADLFTVTAGSPKQTDNQQDHSNSPHCQRGAAHPASPASAGGRGDEENREVVSPAITADPRKFIRKVLTDPRIGFHPNRLDIIERGERSLRDVLLTTLLVLNLDGVRDPARMLFKLLDRADVDFRILERRFKAEQLSEEGLVEIFRTWLARPRMPQLQLEPVPISDADTNAKRDNQLRGLGLMR